MYDTADGSLVTYLGTDMTYIYIDPTSPYVDGSTLTLAAGVDTSTKTGSVYYDLIVTYTEVATGATVTLQTDYLKIQWQSTAEQCTASTLSVPDDPWYITVGFFGGGGGGEKGVGISAGTLNQS